jgi:hypothetical protein
MSPLRDVFTILWNVTSAFFSPKSILFWSKCPCGVENAVYFFDSGSMGIWWNPEDRSKAEKNLKFPSWLRMSSMSGKVLICQFV